MKCIKLIPQVEAAVERPVGGLLRAPWPNLCGPRGVVRSLPSERRKPEQPDFRGIHPAEAGVIGVGVAASGRERELP